MDDPVDCLCVLSDGTRFSIVSILLNHDLCSAAVARRLGISEAAVSQHMRALREAGLVTPERHGYSTHYAVDRARLVELSGMLMEMAGAVRHPCDPDQEGCTAKGDVKCPVGPCPGPCPRESAGLRPCHHRCPRCSASGRVNQMKVAVTHENGEVFQHFGRTSEFKVYDVDDGRIVSSQVCGTDGKGHGELIGVLKGLGVSVLLCGGIGGGAIQGLRSSGISVCPGCSGSADDIVMAYASGALDACGGPTCDHHGEDHQCTCGKH